MGKQQFKKGEVVIQEGTYGKCAYIIISGSVEVSKTYNDTKTVFATLGMKQIFGEMGLIEDKPRSATVVALEDSVLNVVSREAFNENYNTNRKIILPIIKALFEKLRVATATIATNAEKDALSFARKEEEFNQINKMDDKMSLILTGTNEISCKALNGTSLEIKKIPFRVGRGEKGFFGKDNSVLATSNDLYIYEDTTPYYVSLNHFVIDMFENNYIIVNSGSHSGLVVNGMPLKDSCLLQKGDNEVIVGTSFSPFIFTLTIKPKTLDFSGMQGNMFNKS